MITHHTQLLQALIDKHNLKTYLEIGVQNPDNNFNKIKCDFKVGVDPCMMGSSSDGFLIKETSDNFFSINKRFFSLVFIDGLHHYDQVKKDFENSLKWLSDTGFILIHDCLPVDESTTTVPRGTKAWHGDVYKFCMGITNYDGVRYVTYDIDNGCMLIWKDNTVLNERRYLTEDNYNWECYSKYGRSILNVIDEVVI